MDILYRRFVLFTAFIAVMGVFAANIIIETKRPSNLNSAQPNLQVTCQELKLCAIPGNRTKLLVAAINRV